MKRTEFYSLALRIAETEFPYWQFRRKGDWLLAADGDKTIAKVNLVNMFASGGHLRDPQEFIREFLEPYRAAIGPLTWEQAKSKVFPLLVSYDVLAGMMQMQLKETEFATSELLDPSPWNGDLYIVLVIDTPISIAYINRDALNDWQVTKDTLTAQAFENLSSLPMKAISGRSKSGLRWAIVEPDTYAATRAILDETLDAFVLLVGPSYHMHLLARNILHAIETSKESQEFDPSEFTELQRIITANVDARNIFDSGFIVVEALGTTARADWIDHRTATLH